MNHSNNVEVEMRRFVMDEETPSLATIKGWADKLIKAGYVEDAYADWSAVQDYVQNNADDLGIDWGQRIAGGVMDILKECVADSRRKKKAKADNANKA
jgi:hypothetical protein